jgi:chromate transporter
LFFLGLRAPLVDPLTIALAVVSGAVLLRFPVNSTWLVLAGGLIGLLRWAISGA